MKNALQLFLFTLPFFSISQTAEVETWKNLHPNVLCIEDSDVSEELIDRLDENGADYIIYSNELTNGDIIKYDLNQSQGSKLANEEIDVKLWLDEHPNIKIVPRNYFDGLSPEEREVYLKPYIMILKGETVTLLDIQEFQSLTIDESSDSREQ